MGVSKMDTEAYGISCNDFDKTLLFRSKELYEKQLYSDVTLVSDDLVMFSAHKSVLSTASEIFNKLLMMNTKSSEPIIYLKGVHSFELDSMLQFIYLGHANVKSERIEVFVQRTEELQIKGLIAELFEANKSYEGMNETYEGLEQEVKEEASDNLSAVNLIESKHLGTRKKSKNEHSSKSNMKFQTDLYQTFSDAINEIQEKSADVANDDSGVEASFEIQEDKDLHESEMKDFVELRCEQCGKDFTTSYNLKRHVRSVHEQIRYDCNMCKKSFTQKIALRYHVEDNHKTIKKNKPS